MAGSPPAQSRSRCCCFRRSGDWQRAVATVGQRVDQAAQIVRLDIADPDRCLVLFKSDRDAGLILFAGLLLDAALRRLT